MEANNAVCFEFERGVEVITHATLPCQWSMAFESVIGNGNVEELIGEEDKRAGLGWIMSQYSEGEWDLTGAPVGSVRVWKIIIDSVTGKKTKR